MKENHIALNTCEIMEPKTMEEAMSGENSDKWKETSDAEYKSLMENGTWELVELPVGRKPIGCKWIFKVKYAGDGKMERFKARLVARGFTQQYGIDYEDPSYNLHQFVSSWLMQYNAGCWFIRWMW